MARLTDAEIDRIKRDTDLAAVVRSRGVALSLQGGDLVGLCPFHDDKTPSLHVTPAKGLWRCVSCQLVDTPSEVQPLKASNWPTELRPSLSCMVER